MATTQESIPIEDIKEGVVFLKDGGAAVVIQTSAVNFGLLSAEEQIAIIGSFAQMINSLSFPIQITILSKRLDISAYLKLLEKAQMAQVNPLLSQMMIRYRRFIQSLIKDNEVLDKQFYITVPLSNLELGIGMKSKEEKYKKARTILDPKKDQVIRQLNRVGLTAKQLNEEQLIKLFYELFNQSDITEKSDLQNAQTNKAQGNSPVPSIPAHPTPPPAPLIPTEPSFKPPAPATQPVLSTQPVNPVPPQPISPVQPNPIQQSQPKANHPFVVEELTDQA